MTSPQEAFRSMTEKVLLFMAEFIKIWKGNKSIEGAVTIIRSDANSIDTNWETQKFVTKGVGKSKKLVREKLDNDTYIIFSTIKSYAMAEEKTPLYEKYDQTLTEISQYKDTEMGALAKMTAKEIVKLKDVLLPYGLTEELIERFTKEKDEYLAQLAAPAEAASRQRTATLNIKNLVSTLRTTFDKKLDNYMIPYSATHPEFFANYLFARIIYDNPTRPYSLMLTVADEETKLPVPKAKITFVFMADAKIDDIVKKTTKLGHKTMKGMEEGEWKLTIEKPDYVTIIFTIQIVKGELLRISKKIRKKE